MESLTTLARRTVAPRFTSVATKLTPTTLLQAWHILDSFTAASEDKAYLHEQKMFEATARHVFGAPAKFIPIGVLDPHSDDESETNLRLFELLNIINVAPESVVTLPPRDHLVCCTMHVVHDWPGYYVIVRSVRDQTTQAYVLKFVAGGV